MFLIVYDNLLIVKLITFNLQDSGARYLPNKIISRNEYNILMSLSPIHIIINVMRSNEEFRERTLFFVNLNKT